MHKPLMLACLLLSAAPAAAQEPSDLVGAQVMGPDGLPVGEVVEVIEGDGEPRLLIAVEGFMGFREQAVALPLSALGDVWTEDDSVRLDASPQLYQRRIDRWQQRIASAELQGQLADPVETAWGDVLQAWDRADDAAGPAWALAREELEASLDHLHEAWQAAVE